jgi:hypothetical protein
MVTCVPSVVRDFSYVGGGMSHSKFRVVVWLTGVVLVGAHSAAVAANVRVVALSGQHAAGTSAGVVFNAFTEPVLDAAGQATYWARLTGSGVTVANREGVWSEGSGSLELVARSGEHAPGTPIGNNFSGFLGGSVFNPLPLANAAGQTAIRATAGDYGIWSGEAGDLQLVAGAGSQAPDAPSGVNFSYFGVPVFNSAGHTAFQAYLTGSGVIGNTNDYGIWSEGSGNLALVARTGDHAPGTPTGVNYSYVDAPRLNGAGQTSFWGVLRGSGVDQTNDQGVWVERSGAVQLVARRGDHAPGTPIGANYNSISVPTLNTAGKTVFVANLKGGVVDATNDSGIWADTAGVANLIVREGSRAPGTPEGVVFRSDDDLNDPGEFQPAFMQAVVNSAGHTAFIGTLSGAGVDNTNGKGLWSENSGSLELVARTGSHAPGTADDVSFQSMFGLAMNAAGQTAFKAYAGVDSIEFSGLWATDVNGTLQLVARTGVTMEVAPADFRTVNDVTFLAESGGGAGNDDGVSTAFNDRGHLAFEANFTDGSSGVFVSDAVLNDGALPGDFNKNGVVDGADYSVWRKNYSSEHAGYNIWRANFGRSSIGSAVAHAVPEPGSILLLGLVFLGAVGCRKLRKA